MTKLSAFETGLEISVETRNGASKTMCEIDDKNWTEEQFKSLQAFYRTTGRRVQEITVRQRFKPRTLKSFDPATQESQDSPREIGITNRQPH
jgi:hypothetical protein